MREFFQAVGWYWRHGFSWRRAAASLLSAFGVLWLVVETSTFFSKPAFANAAKEYWWLFLLAGLAWAVWENWPKHVVSCRLANRDIVLEIRVGDLFAGDASVVIGCNTSFDTELQSNLISPRSVQGQYTSRYFNSSAHLDVELGNALANVAAAGADPHKQGKHTLYPIGTTAKVRAGDRTAYLCAIARMNLKGNAESSFDEIQRALPKLWEYIGSAGDHGTIAIPILGSGFARVPQTREELIREIIQSFIAACSAQRPCEALSVVIHPKDFYTHNVDLMELGRFLAHVCRYTDFAQGNATGVGQAIAGNAVPAVVIGGSTQPTP